ncbi:alpha/beta hydrolase [Lutibacter sp. TH_r2]|uniref:alpha/beta hydrolase n=1 Tax=Lutibacter sp. TH_r2 TaxID=3082083 RepID=UPI0029537BD2|nr:alpha/beta hydrolase [Lutibacter sp. TH_r2]MDV7185708.1 alpha/beta hydrolase [Lutibacter sp. TH_r2]
MIRILIYLALFICTSVFSQNYTDTELSIPSEKVTLNGNLISINSEEKTQLVIIIPGSGPTDRNGNSVATKNNSLKLLAEGLAKKNIASYRYDKSVLSFTKEDTKKINALRFNNFINEATSVIQYFKNEDSYSKIIVIGHSQGSLVGMVAAKNNIDAFISIAGAGRPIDEVITEQISSQAPYLVDETKHVLSELKKGNTVEDFNPLLASLFNRSVQPFLTSWLKYNPQNEIKKLTIPTLIINGTKDIQVKTEDAKLLHKANTTSQLLLIENMNHIFKEIKGDQNENIASYSKPELPIMPHLTESISTFVNNLK